MMFRIKVLWCLLGLGALLGACRDEAPMAVVSDEILGMDADVIVMNGRHVFTNEEGIRTARLHFDTAYQWQDSVNTGLRGVDLTVFNEDGSERARVNSREGTLDPRAERMMARGEVVLVVPGEDRRIETSELHYDPQAGQIWTDSAFVMIHGTRTIRGGSFTSDLEFRNFQATGTEG